MPNRLADQTSPYLLQHKDNPVDWYPWGPEALERARSEGRPILLSVGYSACHWCHVMERESFEDDATAALMNRHFVNIKVDREERPDLDEIYMRAVQAFSGGHGGWPMTVFLTPDGTPYFAGTYFPPEPRQGMPSFSQVLNHAAGLFHQDKAQLQRVTGEIGRYLHASGRLPAPAPSVGDGWLQAVVKAAADDHDVVRGGFGTAPKFPPHGTLAVLLAHHLRTGDKDSLAMATGALSAMAKGGMYDLLAGGFARYSVDPDWRIPHFEKMLYDNAQLIPLYVDAWRITGDPQYERVVRETIDWLLTEMRDPAGGFWSALDADSEGEEGRFYAWTPDGVAEALAGSAIADGAGRVCELLQVTAAGTFEHGTSVLRLEQPLEALSDDDRALVEAALPLMKQARSKRVRPGLDDKVLTAWNALTISALAQAAAVFGEADWHRAAAEAAVFLLERATVDGRLMRTWKATDDGAGRAHLPGYADDHAFLVAALLDLHACDYDTDWLRDAVALMDWTLTLFWDDQSGGLFYTGADAEQLITRSKHMMGGAEPSANGVAALSLLRLAALTGRDDLREKGELIVRCYRPLLDQAPRALGAEALAAAWCAGPTAEIGIVGARDGDDTQALVAELRRTPRPFAVSALVPPDADADALALLPWMADREAVDGKATAYVCEGFTCKLPVTDPAALADQLAGQVAPATDGGGLRDHAPELPDDRDRWLNSTEALQLADLRGQVVVLDFWTSCCINCMHLLPELHALEERFADQPLTVIGVHTAKFPAEQDKARVRRAVRRLDIGHPVINDPDQALWQAYTVKAWPSVVVLDVEGRIAWRGTGELSADELSVVVQRLLDEGREAGSLRSRAHVAPTETLEDTELDHPGKVHVYPGDAAQAQGADPFGPDARLYIADTGHHRIIEASLRRGSDGWPQARILRSFGSGQPGLLDSRASLARFQAPQGICRSGDTLWVADTGNHALRAVDLDSESVRTVAGTGQLARQPVTGRTAPTSLPLRSPWDVAVASADAGMPGADDDHDIVFVAMAGSHQVWIYLGEHDEIGPFIGSGREDHVDGAPQDAALAQPSALVVFGRYIFFADAETSSIRAFDLAERKVGTVVGRGLFDFGDIDGPPDKVRMQHPLGLSLADDALFVADTFNDKIKKVSLQGGHTTTVAGGGGELSEPGGLAAAGEFLVVADTNHHEIKVVHRETGEVRSLELQR